MAPRKPAKPTDAADTGKRKPGRPSTGVPTVSFCCRAPTLLVESFDKLADLTGSTRPGSELLRAAEDHLVRMFQLIRANPRSPLIRDIAGVSVPQFLATAEAYLKQAGRWPIPKIADE